MKITNEYNIALPLAVWLLHDDYDHVSEENYISATALMKPIRQIVLARRIPASDHSMDISENLSRSMGTAIHDSIEKSWTKNLVPKLLKLGIPEKVAQSVMINPTEEERAANPEGIACYMEQRSIRSIGGYRVGGKFDMILEGRLYDHKTSSVYTYIKGTKDEDYALQGGIYRWLNPDKVIDDKIYINFVFTDWQKMMTKTAGYPPIKAIEHPVTMLGYTETEQWIKAKLRELDRCWNLPESELPECTDKDLWRSEPKYKYYAKPDTAKEGGRATKNFDDLVEANKYLGEQGKGIVVTVPGEVKACNYCAGFDACTQKNRYFNL